MIINTILLFYSLMTTLLIGIVLKQYAFNRHLKEMPFKLPNLSIVIPFRNEEKNLEPLLKSLSLQQYPSTFEILLVDDNSTDSSVEIIQKYIAETGHKNITVLNNIFDNTCNITSKQLAIHTGINNARYDFIVLTDADMHYDSDWLVTLGDELGNGADLVFGRTAISQNYTSLFSKLQSFQLDFLFSVAYTLFHGGITGSCMGNNMLISRSRYIATGGHVSIGYSIVEDRALFAFFERNRFKCAISSPFIAKAFTYPCTTITQFYHQMRRWARGGFSMGFTLLPIGVLFAFQNTLFCLSFFKILSTPSIVIVVVNFFITWLFTALCFKRIKSKVKIVLFPIFILFIMAESIVFLASLIFFPTIKWKGRALRR